MKFNKSFVILFAELNKCVDIEDGRRLSSGKVAYDVLDMQYIWSLQTETHGFIYIQSGDPTVELI